MKKIKIKSITKKQAKSYMVVALENLKNSSSKISKQEMWNEMETVMSLYTPKQAVEKVKNKINDTYRVSV